MQAIRYYCSGRNRCCRIDNGLGGIVNDAQTLAICVSNSIRRAGVVVSHLDSLKSAWSMWSFVANDCEVWNCTSNFCPVCLPRC